MTEQSFHDRQKRAIRVFISSTFRDMYEEREELVKFTFPELRRRCRARRVEFVGVDLRWGITDEQSAEGKVLPICLAEIEGCRPYFIGLLGERYGWVPHNIDDDLASSQPWLREHQEKSVTELEILHGVLNDPDMKGLAFFYFRNKETSDAIEHFLSKEPAYIPEPETSRVKLNILKQRIEKSSYPLKKDYPDTKTLGQWVLDDLWSAIDKRYPIEEVPTELEQRRIEHDAFASLRRKVYIERKDYYGRLNKHAAGDGPPLVILGESGSGKSALLANWAYTYQQEHPEDFMICHYIGSTVDSADYIQMLKGIMEEIQQRYEPETKKEEDISSISRKENTIPTDPQKVVEAFPLWLARAAARGKFILILDALNQLEYRDNAPDLGWLPWSFSPHVRLIVSTLPGRSLDALKKRTWPEMTVGSMEKTDQEKYIPEYLAIYGKALEDPQIKRIIAARQTANPLYLRTLLEELRVFGIHQDLDKEIEHYLQAQTVDSLFALVLERLEKDYERDRPGLVKDTMSLIWASRRGLSETELLELLGTEESPMPRALFSPLYLALDESLVSRSGLLSFFHDFLKKAVESTYLTKLLDKQQAHLTIANNFDKRTLDDRKADELPWQLCQSESWQRLKGCVTDMDMFPRMIEHQKQYELMGYWQALIDKFDVVAAYNDSLEQYEKKSFRGNNLAYRLNQTAYFLMSYGKYHGAEPLFRKALKIRIEVLGPNHLFTATSYLNLAWFYETMGIYDEALSLYYKAYEISNKVLGLQHLDTVKILANLGRLFQVKGDYIGAEALYQKTLSTREKISGPEHPDTASSLHSLSWLYFSMGKYNDALPLCQRALSIRERVLGPEHPDTSGSLNNLSLIYRAMGDYDQALPLIQRALQLNEKIYGSDHPQVATNMNNYALVLIDKADYDNAELFLHRALNIEEKVFGIEHRETAHSLANLGWLFEAKGDYDSAIPFYQQALAIREAVLGIAHPHTIKTANNIFAIAQTLRDKNEFERASQLYRRVLLTYTNIAEAPYKLVSSVLQNMAICHNELAFNIEVPAKNWKEAEYHYKKAIDLFNKIPDHTAAANAELNLKTMYYLSGQKVDLERVKELTRILEDVGSPKAEKGKRLLKDLS